MTRTERVLARRWKSLALLAFPLALTDAVLLVYVRVQAESTQADQLAAEANLRGNAVSTLAGDARALAVPATQWVNPRSWMSKHCFRVRNACTMRQIPSPQPARPTPSSSPATRGAPSVVPTEAIATGTPKAMPTVRPQPAARLPQASRAIGAVLPREPPQLLGRFSTPHRALQVMDTQPFVGSARVAWDAVIGGNALVPGPSLVVPDSTSLRPSYEGVPCHP
ncbi:hypothetical protein [Streptomyces sp. NPDC004270]